jgi:hypothetical protein
MRRVVELDVAGNEKLKGHECDGGEAHWWRLCGPDLYRRHSSFSDYYSIPYTSTNHVSSHMNQAIIQ